MELCNRNCNECPIIFDKNSRMVTKIMNQLFNEFGGKVNDIVNDYCPNLTVCYDCRIDDFFHLENCELSKK